MLQSQLPGRIPQPWGNSTTAPGNFRAIPATSQIGVVNGQASWPDGFPPLCFIAVGAGGYPPDGRDVNQVLLDLSAINQWYQAGGPSIYDATFSGEIGGYPAGALLLSTSIEGALWLCLVDNNTNNPDITPTGWLLCLIGQPQLDARYLRLAPGSVWYVNASLGSDSLYDGTSPTVSGIHGPWATIQHAINTIATYASTSMVTINVADGTNVGGASFTQSFISIWNLIGDVTTPSNCILEALSSGSGPAIGRAINVGFGCTVNIKGFYLNNSTYDNIAVQSSATVSISNCQFAPPSTSGCIGVYGGYAQLGAALVFDSGTYTDYVAVSQSGTVKVGYHDAFITIPCNMNFNTGTVSSATMTAASGGSIIVDPSETTFTGTVGVTGLKYTAVTCGGLSFGGGGLGFLPGTVSGSATSPGYATA